MKHYVLLKLAPGADVIAVQQKTRKAYDKLDAEFDWLNHPVVYRCCGADNGFDIMAVVEIDEEEKLPACTESEHYRKLTEHLKDLIAARATFDHY